MADRNTRCSGEESGQIIDAKVSYQASKMQLHGDNSVQEHKSDLSKHFTSDEESISADIRGNDGKAADSRLIERPKGFRFALLFLGLLLGNLFVGYDSSCIGTLTPVITDHFHALNDFGWYSIAFLLAQSATMLMYGQLYTFYSMKNLYILSCAIFVFGTILCAAASSSAAFTVGRAFSGLGAAGVFAGSNIILSQTTSLKHRSSYIAICGGVECFALALGPLISGTIAHYSTWRVSFWVNVPISATAIVVMLFGVRQIPSTSKIQLGAGDRLKRLDLVGFATNVPMAISFVLGLEWAGTTYMWSDWRIILLLAIAAVLFAAFLVVEHKADDDGMVPLQMLRRRTVAFASVITFCNFASLSVVSFYLPIYFQAIRGASTFSSGLMYLPLAVPMAMMALASGPLTSMVGYCNPALIVGGFLMAVGAGLITTFSPDTSAAKWICFQILYGAGVGLAFQPPYVVVQAALSETFVPKTLVLLSFSQQLGGIVMLAVAQNVFLVGLRTRLSAIVPGLEQGIILDSGALGVIDAVPLRYRDEAILAYNDAIRAVHHIALGLACFVAVCSVGVEWKPVKKGEDAETAKEDLVG